LLASFYLVGQYNDLQRNDVAADTSFSMVINQYTRRSELVPNLVAVVKSYGAQESALFSEIAATRARLPGLPTDEAGMQRFNAAHNQLAGQMSRLLLVAEKYPELKASSLYQDLMVQLEGTENRLAYARQYYLASVADYNFGIRRFPGNLLAAQAGFKARPTTHFAAPAVVVRPVSVDMK